MVITRLRLKNDLRDIESVEIAEVFDRDEFAINESISRSRKDFNCLSLRVSLRGTKIARFYD
jgi:hypothetical protein